MLYMVPVRLTTTKGARFKAVVEFDGPFQFKLVEASSAAECGRILQAGVRKSDPREIGSKRYVANWTLEDAKRMMRNTYLSRKGWPEVTPEIEADIQSDFESLLRTVATRGILGGSVRQEHVGCDVKGAVHTPACIATYPRSESCVTNSHQLCDRDYCRCWCHAKLGTVLLPGFAK